MEINELMVKENKMWRQRAKSFWLVGGDKNSKYFHSRATQRHCRNRITGINNSLGKWVHHSEEIAKAFIEYYQNLFTSSNRILGDNDMNSIPTLVTAKMNSQLSQEFMEWEVQAVLKQMAPLKAPGPDGIPPLFYQNCKVEFIQPSNWLYSVPNLLVIQHLVTLYLGGFDVRVVSEIE